MENKENPGHQFVGGVLSKNRNKKRPELLENEKDLQYWLDFFAEKRGYKNYNEAEHNFNKPDFALIKADAYQAYFSLIAAKVIDEHKETQKLNSTHFDIIQEQKRKILSLEDALLKKQEIYKQKHLEARKHAIELKKLSAKKLKSITTLLLRQQRQ